MNAAGQPPPADTRKPARENAGDELRPKAGLVRDKTGTSERWIGFGAKRGPCRMSRQVMSLTQEVKCPIGEGGGGTGATSFFWW